MRSPAILHMRKFLEVWIAATHVYVAVGLGILTFEKRCIKLSETVIEIQAEYLWISSALNILYKEWCFCVLIKQTGAEDIIHVQ